MEERHMYIDNAEAASLASRIRVSKQMAMSAVNSCARHAHEALAGRYQAKLTAMLRIAVTNLPIPTNSRACTVAIPA
jgi:hypothetical protein